MNQYYISCVIILGLCLTNEMTCDVPPMNPPSSQTLPASATGAAPPIGGPSPVCDDSAITALYAMIPDIVQGCISIQTQISQGYQFTPNGQSQMALILQNIQWQDMLVTCDMIIKTKQMADQVQASAGNAQSSTSGSVSASIGGPPNAPGAVPTTGDPAIAASLTTAPAASS